MSILAMSQELPRQGLWGIYTTQLADSAKQVLKLDGDAVEIKWLKAEGTASLAGLEIGDILYQRFVIH